MTINNELRRAKAKLSMFHAENEPLYQILSDMILLQLESETTFIPDSEEILLKINVLKKRYQEEVEALSPKDFKQQKLFNDSGKRL